MKKRWFLIAIILLLTHGFLVAKQDVTITSSYETEQYLQFQYGPPPVLSSFNSGDIEIYPANLCALLGTLTISTNGNNLFDPSLININVSSTIAIEGYVRKSDGTIFYNNAIQSTLMAITLINNEFVEAVPITGNEIQLVSSTGNIFPGQTTSMSTYIVLIAENIGDDSYIPGVVYTLNDDSFIGTFGVSADGQGQQEFEEIPVEVDSSGTTTPTAPFIPTAPAPGDELEIPFEGDFDFDQQFILTVPERFENFDLDDALMGIQQIIARLQLQVLLAEQNTVYGVEIAFSSSDPTGFKLHLNGDISEYYFPYRLFLGNTEITNNEFMQWNLPNSQNNDSVTAIEDVSVLVDASSYVENAPQGFYKDTVTVLIVPNDTI